MNKEALSIVHRVLIIARARAGEGCDAKKMFNILDSAEYLVGVMIHQDDWVVHFRYALEGLGEKYPEFAGLLGEFDKNMRQRSDSL